MFGLVVVDHGIVVVLHDVDHIAHHRFVPILLSSLVSASLDINELRDVTDSHNNFHSHSVIDPYVAPCFFVSMNFSNVRLFLR